MLSRGAESSCREDGPAEQAGILCTATELVWRGLLSPREMGEVGFYSKVCENRESSSPSSFPHLVCNQRQTLERVSGVGNEAFIPTSVGLRAGSHQSYQGSRAQQNRGLS